MQKLYWCLPIMKSRIPYHLTNSNKPNVVLVTSSKLMSKLSYCLLEETLNPASFIRYKSYINKNVSSKYTMLNSTTTESVARRE